MSKTSAKTALKVECCSVCKDEEKRDFNLDYGTYYYEDCGRRANVVEVFLLSSYFVLLNPCLPQARDQNPEYDDYDYMESDMGTVVTQNNSLYHNN